MWKSILTLLFGWLFAGPAVLLITPPPLPPAPTVPSTPLSVTASGQKILYLTFDADMTPAMLRHLREGKVSSWYDPAIPNYLLKNRVPATVFSTGMFAELYPELIKQMARSGDVSIENHSYDHAAFEPNCYGLATLTKDAQKRVELIKTQQILHALTGSTPAYFRYPGLCHNDHDNQIVASAGLTVNDGDIISGDAFNKNPASIVSAVEKRAHAGGVVVMHLGGPNAPATGAALTAIIPKLRDEGYVFARL